VTELVGTLDELNQRLERLERGERPRTRLKKVTANGVTIVVGGTDATSVVANLRTAFDGLFFHVDEVAATPGINVLVDFAGVTRFTSVQCLSVYAGSSTHAVAIQLYNYTTTTWDTFNAAQDGQHDITTVGGYIMDNHSFFVPDCRDYISAGVTLLRYYHTMAGTASHDLYIDCVALYI